MKTFSRLFIFAVPLLLFSCIRDEAPNAEADILTFDIGSSQIKGDPVITNDKIRVMGLPGMDLTRLAPTFTLSAGATAEPESGTVRDFTTPQLYTITSQDRKWQKTYVVSVDITEMHFDYSFENFEVNKKYHVFYEINSSDIRQDIWATGNPGFVMSGAGNAPEDFPSYCSPDGYRGRCAKLTTCKTGFLGALVNKPIAAGNLFLGTFDGASAMRDPLRATHFGLSFGLEPLKMEGFYKYKAGETMTDEKFKPIPSLQDSCNIYAVFYETDENLKYLDGTNVTNHPNIIAEARIPYFAETHDWKFFSIPFVLKEGKTIDPQKLADFKYNLAVVFTSSKRGAEFKAAVGSTLYVDEIKIVCNK